MLISKTQVKMQEKCEKNVRKNQNTSPTRKNVSILQYALGKNASQLCFAHVLLVFCLRFACVLLAFCLRFACVLLAFCLRFANKPYQNVNPTHGVIWP